MGFNRIPISHQTHPPPKLPLTGGGTSFVMQPHPTSPRARHSDSAAGLSSNHAGLQQPLLEAIHRQRAAEQITLVFVAAKIAQDAQLFLGFNALSHHA